MVERLLCMQEAEGSMPLFSTSTFGVVVTYFPSKEVPRFRLPEGAIIFYFDSNFGNKLPFVFVFGFVFPILSQFLTETH